LRGDDAAAGGKQENVVECKSFGDRFRNHQGVLLMIQQSREAVTWFAASSESMTAAHIMPAAKIARLLAMITETLSVIMAASY
jgi:hypothetical protein